MRQGFIFDADGTLIDSMPIWKTVGQVYLRQRGIEPPADVEMLFKTSTFTETAAYFQRLGVHEKKEEIIQGIVALVHEAYATEVPVKPGVAEALSQVSQRQIPMCVLTASEQEYLTPCLEHNGILQYFSAIFTCTQLKKTKKEPSIFIETAQSLGCAPEETVVFEDSLHCILAAKAAGCRVAAVQDEASKEDWEKICQVADWTAPTVGALPWHQIFLS